VSGKRISEEIHLREVKSSVASKSTIATVPQAAIPERAPFVDYRKAIRPPETVPPAKVDRFHGQGAASPGYGGQEGQM
jgi:hypothetical protein